MFIKKLYDNILFSSCQRSDISLVFYWLYCSCCICYLKDPMLKLFRYSISNFKFQAFSISVSHWLLLWCIN